VSSEKNCVCAGADPEDKSSPDGFYQLMEPNFSNELLKAASERKLCIPCPEGADCQVDSTTLKTMSAQPGFWRPTPMSATFSSCAVAYTSLDRQALAKDRCCPIDASTNVSVCKNQSNTNPCRRGYTGPLCRACDASLSFVAINNNQACNFCEGGASFSAGISSLLGISLLLICVMVIALVFCFKERHSAHKAKAAAKTFGQIKLLVSFLQILSSMPVAFDGVPW